MHRLACLLLVSALFVLTGCDMLGVESASALAARKEAEGKAVGGACRHAGRAIEDCYAQNKKADKAAVFAGWREMNDYMRENKIDTVPPQAAGSAEEAEDKGEKKTAKGGDKPDKAEKAAKAETGHGKDS
jgi:hypothetical protein